MGKRPMLGGLKRAQQFLDDHGYTFSAFQVTIHDPQLSQSLRTMSIDEAIQGSDDIMREVMEFQLRDDDGRIIRFGKPIKSGRGPYTDFAEAVRCRHQDPILQVYSDPAFREFFDSTDGLMFWNLARWGKIKPSLLDRIRCRFFPRRYATEVFA